MSTLIANLSTASLDLVLFAALAWAAARLFGRRRSPRIAALLWTLVMVRTLAGVATGASFPFEPWSLDLDLPASSSRGAHEEIEVFGGSPLAPASGTAEAAVPGPGAALGLAWAAGVCGLLVLALRDRLRLRRMIAEASPAPGLLHARLAAAAARLGVRHPPALLVTDALESPALAGTVSPVILLPRWLAEEGTPEQVDWALGHEVMHRKLNDPLAGAVRHLFQILFFFHPLAWWVGKRWEEAAELACDRALVRSEEEAASYAERLYEMLVKARGRRRPALAAGLFATRTQIGRRIASLLKDPVAPARLNPAGVLVLGLFALLSASVGFGAADAAWTSGDVRMEVELTDGRGWTGELQAEGRIGFAEGREDIVSLSPGGSLDLTETEDGVTRRLEVRSGPGGRLERSYFVDGRRREYDRDAQAWVAKALPRYYRLMGGDKRNIP